jgi:hypothetical protein
MAEINRFKFEDGNYDFPFYNKNPHIPKWGWIVLFLVFLIGFVFTMSNKLHFAILACVVQIVPVLYFLKWDYKAIFRMPSLRDIVLVVALFASYMIYAFAMDLILSQFGIVSSGTVDPAAVDVMTLITSVFSIMGEEFFKFIPFMFFLRVIYKFTDNRKLSVVMSVALIMLMFASVHAYNPVMFVFALFIQGFGSIFELYGYIKTKNILVSYIAHLLTDEFVFIMLVFGLI